MAYRVVPYTVMADTVIAYIVMAYIVMAGSPVGSTLPERAIFPSSSNSRDASIARTVRSMKKTPSPGSSPPGTTPFAAHGGQNVTLLVPPMLIATRHFASAASGRSMMLSYVHVHGVPLPPAATSAGRKSPAVVMPVCCRDHARIFMDAHGYLWIFMDIYRYF